MRGRRSIASSIAVFCLVTLGSSARADSFDVPTTKRVVDFGLSENNLPGQHQFRLRLYCFYYPKFIIKEFDNEGEKGVQWVSVAPGDASGTPACVRTHTSTEWIFEPPSWLGYFEGVKGNLLFLQDPDGTGGGRPFTVPHFRTRRRL